MASSCVRALLLLSAVVGRCAADHDELRSAIEELQQLATRQQERIQQLDAELYDGDRRMSEVVRGRDAITTTTLWAESLYGPYEIGKGSYSVMKSMELAVSQSWLVICGALVMFMQAGFAMVEAGSCRAKNVQNVLLKNLVDISVAFWGWWMFGWSFAFTGLDSEGFKENGFMGASEMFASNFLSTRSDGQQEPTDQMARFFFNWAFCAMAATIISGGVAERLNFPGHVFIVTMMTTFIYPCVAGATWGNGFLAVEAMNDSGYIDFAGSGVVHMTGGIGALVGAVMVGPRKGRFPAGVPLKERPFKQNAEFDPHSLPLIVLGTFILWFGWYGMNCGSTMGMSKLSTGMLAAQVAMNTTMSASAGGLVVFLTRYAMFRKYDIGGFCNGILAGLVSITAGCSNVEAGSAVVIGAVGGLVYQIASSTLKMLQIDDVVDAFPVHGAAGMWGVFAAAIFDWGFGLYQVSGWSGFKCIKNKKTLQCKGLVDGMGKDLISSNMCEMLFIIVWVGGLCTLLFLPLKLTHHLRVKDSDQAEGGADNNKAYEMPAAGGNAAGAI